MTIPYATLAGDPTSEARICWIDDSDGADGSEQTLDWDDGQESTDGDEVPGSDGDIYKYEVKLTDLEPESSYSGTIDGSESIDFETFPDGLGENRITISIVSDQHIDIEMVSGDAMQPLADQEPDLLLIVGDVTSDGHEVNLSRATDWRDYWGDHIATLQDESGKLVPTFCVPGNHEVGNGTDWDGLDDGDNTVDPETGYFQFFFDNVVDLDPEGENYGAITIGDYLQVVGLDTHSAFIEESADWLESAIDETVDVCLPIYHSALLQGGDRTDSDDELAANLRHHWGPILADADNIYTTFSGHFHVRKRSARWTVVETEPDDYHFEVDGGFLTKVTDSNGIVEFGDGYRNNRQPYFDWYLVRSETDTEAFYSVEFGSGLTVNEIDADGTIRDTETFGPGTTAKRKVATLKDVEIANATFGVDQ